MDENTPDSGRDLGTLVKQVGIMIVLLILSLAVQAWQSFGGSATRTQSWEYIIEGPSDEQLQSRLQVLGAGGWELVSARRATTDRDGKTNGIYEMIFRRPVQDGGAVTPLLPAATPSR